MLADEVALEDEHEQGLAVVQLDEVEMLDPVAERPGCGDEADRVGSLRKRRRGDLEDVLHAGRHDGEEGVDLTANRNRNVLLVHEEVHVVPVAEVGGNAPGRRVRLDEISDLAQGRQLVADGRRRPRGEMHCERRRADRNARARVVGDDGLEDLLLALIERDLLHFRPEATVVGDRPPVT